MTTVEPYCEHFDCACPPFVTDGRVGQAEWARYVKDMDISYEQQANAKVAHQLGEQPEHVEQPMPRRVPGVDMQELVIGDMKDRYSLGVARYGMGVRVGNGRDMLRDLYEELLDACVYARGLMEERDRG